MPNKAVFVDRDRTLIDDPGYISDPSAVKLLPGVELAIKSLAQSGYKIIVVTNQSGVARGLLTEETLEKIHAEVRRQLSERGVNLDAIYYCPYHPEGTVEGYAIDSELRKPRPGMLLKAAKEHDIDLSLSWMVGDSPRDIEAGQRAGCRTIRVRVPGQHLPSAEEDEDVRADYVVRNLVDAARIIMREEGKPAPRPIAPMEAAAPQIEPPPPEKPAESPAQPSASKQPEESGMTDSDVLREILRNIRQFTRHQMTEEFSLTRLIGGILQVLALLSLVFVLMKMFGGKRLDAQLWAQIAIVLQLMSISFFMMKRNK